MQSFLVAISGPHGSRNAGPFIELQDARAWARKMATAQDLVTISITGSASGWDYRKVRGNLIEIAA